MTLRAEGAWLADELDVNERTYSGDGSVAVRFSVHSTDWLSRFLLGHAEVIADIDAPDAVAAARARLG